MPEGAVETLPGGERSSTFVRLVLVVEEENLHGSHRAGDRAPVHRGRTLNSHPETLP
jgi:hypothetical protein